MYNRFVRWAVKGVWSDLFEVLATAGVPPAKPPARQLGGQGAPLCGRRQRGERGQAIGRSRGGRTTKIHALTDGAVGRWPFC